MKRYSCTVYILPIILLFIFSRCDDYKDNIESVVETQIKKLTGKWETGSVTLDGAVQEGWDNFILRVYLWQAQRDIIRDR